MSEHVGGNDNIETQQSKVNLSANKINECVSNAYSSAGAHARGPQRRRGRTDLSDGSQLQEDLMVRRHEVDPEEHMRGGGVLVS